MNLTNKERTRVIANILSWKVEEVEIGGNEEFTDEMFDNWVNKLDGKTDEELHKSWTELVGRWVLSRTDVTIPEGISTDEYLAGQFEAIKNGDDVNWGFVRPVQPSAVRRTV